MSGNDEPRNELLAKWLVVDDEPSICWGLARLGKQMGHQVATASSAEQGLELARRDPPDLIVLDVRLPGQDGISAMDAFRESCGDVPIVIMTAHGDLQTAVEAVKQGAWDYLLKPFDLSAMQAVVERALTVQDAPAEPPVSVVSGMLGTSSAMQQVFKQLALAAVSEANVLLAGESGTGKELAARALHRYSRRADGPFVAVNVASLSPTLAESELFGHVRGAFTGADQQRMGLVQRADGGTLFLDEVADIAESVQVKMLRVLEHREVTPVGATTPLAVDFRVVSASHRDLQLEIAENRFRHDLFFRLAAFRIDLPPLRTRPEDIPELARLFLGQAGADAAVLSDEVLDELQRRPWYGNVRELRNAIEHAAIVCRGGQLAPDHLPPPALPVDPPGPAVSAPSLTDLLIAWTQQQLNHASAAGSANLYEQLLGLVEPPVLQTVLDHCHGQYAAAARLLGLHRTTLRKKLSDPNS